MLKNESEKSIEFMKDIADLTSMNNNGRCWVSKTDGSFICREGDEEDYRFLEEYKIDSYIFGLHGLACYGKSKVKDCWYAWRRNADQIEKIEYNQYIGKDHWLYPNYRGNITNPVLIARLTAERLNR